MISIPRLFDQLTDSTRDALEVISQEDLGISELRSRIRKERKIGLERFKCALCRDPVYVSNSHHTAHFAHYSDSGENCFWRTYDPRHLREISAKRFRGRKVSELHIKLVLAIEAICQQSAEFTHTGEPDDTFFGKAGTGHRFPDLQTTFRDKKIAFELQLSQTYLPTIVDREVFYRDNQAFLVWLTHDFELSAQKQMEKDLTAIRSRQIYSVSEQTIIESLGKQRLVLNAHVLETTFTNGKIERNWNSKRIDFGSLLFDEYLFEPTIADAWKDEYQQISAASKDEISKFETYWHKRDEWNSTLANRSLEKFRLGIPFDENRTGGALQKRALNAMSARSGQQHFSYEVAQKLGLELLLDTLFYLRDDKNYRNKQTMIGAFDTCLHTRPHFADVLLAVAYAYNQEQLIKREKVLRKTLGLLETNIQSHDFDALVGLLFPRAATYVRASCKPYILNKMISLQR